MAINLLACQEVILLRWFSMNSSFNNSLKEFVSMTEYCKPLAEKSLSFDIITARIPLVFPVKKQQAELDCYIAKWSITDQQRS